MAKGDPPKPTKRTFRERLIRFIIANAVTLSIVAVIALPLSYIAGQHIIRHRELSKLDSPDPAQFADGLGYVYRHAPGDSRVQKAAIQRIESLPPEQAAELFWALAQAMTQGGEPLHPREIAVGTRLLERSEFTRKFVIYNQFVQMGLGTDPAVLAALATALDDPDDRRFGQAVAFYDSRFLWLRDHVPADAWLRWAVLLSHSDAALTQLRSAELLGDMPDALDDPRVAQGLAHLAASDNPTVRGAVLDAAAGYARVADDPVPYEQVLIALTEDDNKTLARRAWITLGLLNPLSGFRADWRSVEPAVAEAMLWAAVKTNPDRPEPALEAWDAGLEHEAALALHQSPQLQEQYTEGASFGLAGDRLLLGVLGEPTTQAERELFWRCLPVLRRNLLWVWMNRKDVYDSLFQDAGVPQLSAGDLPAIVGAVCYYTGTGFQPADAEAPVALFQIAMAESLPTLPSELTQEGFIYYEALGVLWPGGPIELDDPFLEIEDVNPELLEQPLAGQFSGPEPWQARFYMSVHGNWGRIDHVSDAVMANLHVASVLDLVVVGTACDTFLSDFGGIHQGDRPQELHSIRFMETLIRASETERRNTGVLIAGMAKARPTLIEGATAELIRQHPDMTDRQLHDMSDAQLADLGLRRVDALTTLLDIAETAPDREDRYEQIALLKLALWMRGDLGDDFIPEAERMLEDDRLPTSTVLMCLLHMQRPAALYYLFDPPHTQGSGSLDLYDLFVNQRWWHVFSRLVPDPDLDLWLWGDPGAQAFQFEVMRQWVQVNRWRLEAGWWPGATPDE